MFYILGHEEPDADCAGSQRALGHWLERRGKTVHLCSKGPWQRPEIADWKDFFLDAPPLASGERVLTVILDCSSPDRTGFEQSQLPNGLSLVIDHHAAGSDFGDVRCVVPSSPSTTLLIQELMEDAGDPPDSEEAGWLFLGFCTDTGFFRHLEPGRGDSLNYVARLVDGGASPSAVFRHLSGGRSLGSRRLLGRIMDRAELHFDGRLVMSWEKPSDRAELGDERDSDMLYQMLMGIAGVEAAAVVREQDGFCSVGLRSVTDLNVAEIAGILGGGGHKKAAGCAPEGDRADVMDRLLGLFGERF